MDQDTVLDLFRKSGALLEGHFRLSSGLHSDRYLQSALVLQFPEFAAALGLALADRTRHLQPTVVLSPAIGGIVIGQEVGRALGVRSIFAERQDGPLVLRRGFLLEASDRVLVVEDVITTGGSTRETAAVAEAFGAHVTGVAAIVDRGSDPARVTLPTQALMRLDVPSYAPEACPLCASGGGDRQARLASVLATRECARLRPLADDAVDLRTLKLTVEYDGTNYVGWQRQAEGVSIQALLEEAMAPFEGGPLTVHGAGRTDAGVHARGQVASVRIHTEHGVATLQRALNAVLPVDVRIVKVEDALPDFHARFDAVSKTYEYRIANTPFVSAFEHRYVWHVPGALDVEAMRHGALALVGRHDFAAFQSTGGEVHTTERTIQAISVGSDRGQTGVGSESDPGLTPIVIRVTGDGFLRHMVRTIAGTLVDVGLGRWPASRVAAILRGRDRALAGRVAPPSGLVLVRVDYA